MWSATPPPSSLVPIVLSLSSSNSFSTSGFVLYRVNCCVSWAAIAIIWNQSTYLPSNSFNHDHALLTSLTFIGHGFSSTSWLHSHGLTHDNIRTTNLYVDEKLWLNVGAPKLGLIPPSKDKIQTPDNKTSKEKSFYPFSGPPDSLLSACGAWIKGLFRWLWELTSRLDLYIVLWFTICASRKFQRFCKLL